MWVLETCGRPLAGGFELFPLMLFNHLKVAFRGLRRQAGFTGLNVMGLTLGLTACLLIGLFVRDEYGYDRFLPAGERTYRLYNVRTDNESTESYAVIPPAVATTLAQQYPEVEQAMRILMLPGKYLVEGGRLKAYEDEGLIADSNFFSMFPLPFRYGSPVRALEGSSSIVLSRPMAEQYFGAVNPVGKQVLIDKQPFQVTGVFDLGDRRFHLAPRYVIPIKGVQLPPKRMQSWSWQQLYTYVRLKPGADHQALEAKFQDFLRRNIHALTKGSKLTYLTYFQPLEQVHLYSASFKYDNAIRGNITYVRALSVIAVFILLIACFNYVNLATARSLQRAREVGVRKAIGASRGQLMGQFLSETVLLTLMSFLVSVGLTVALLPWLNEFTGKHIQFDLLTNPVLAGALVLLALVVGVGAGLYPALVLSGFQPVKVLKGAVGGMTRPGATPWLRHSLVVVQFSLSILLTISSLVVYRQVNYLHDKSLGFQKDQILFFPMRGDNLTKNHEAFKSELTKLAGVSAVSIGYGFPGDAVAGDDITVPGRGEDGKYGATHLAVDYDYIRTLGLEMVAGRPFSKAVASDKDHAFILNETAVRELGFGTPEKAIGQPLHWKMWDPTPTDSIKRGQVIGVVRDFHYKSLYDKVETAVLHIYPQAYWKVAVKLSPATAKRTIEQVEAVWSRFAPDYPLEYQFLDDNFSIMYEAEDKLKTLLGVFTGIAIFVGCLGLFGLAAYAAARRLKEIGIRKVLGASVQSLVVLLSRDFIKLVLVAVLIASPLAWYFLRGWLEDFAYRIELSWWIFVLAGLIAVTIALLTVSFQAIRAALTNPVQNLRTE